MVSSRKIAQDNYKNHVCVWCGYGNPKIVEVAHVNRKRDDNRAENLVFLCPTHHREYDTGLIETKMILERRKFVERDPKADWSILIGKTKEELSKIAKKAVVTRKNNIKNKLKKVKQ